ncbi:hypothetical protein, partial [Pseudoalteromonas sp. 24-MNA-CIBAN-0067]|uniref:hypothetical protein n=1 Tax=Pseudoalteromonas sp. 24-MNA-CIBAN-0067 TaxID=3140423 RepID=UPI003319B82F
MQYIHTTLYNIQLYKVLVSFNRKKNHRGLPFSGHETLKEQPEIVYPVIKQPLRLCPKLFLPKNKFARQSASRSK